MPNHVATILRLTGDRKQIAEFVDAISLTGKEVVDGCKYDFRKLLPCPKELVAVSSPVRIVSKEEYAEAVKTRKAALKNAKNKDFVQGLPLTKEISAKFKKKFGADNWYDWMHQNYGTKWGMYEISMRDEGVGTVEFFYLTAWSPATAYFVNISQKYPKVEFYHEFADEGGGFVGFERIEDGEVTNSVDYPWRSDEGIEIRQNVGYYHDEDEEEEEEAE